MVHEKCIHCENHHVSLNAKGCCGTCSGLLKKITDLENGKNIPKSLEYVFKYGDRDKAIKLYVDGLKSRLRLVRDEHVEQEVSAHDLESRLSQVSKLVGKKSFPKYNDIIAARLGDGERLFVYQLLTKILLMEKPNYIDSVRWKI